MHSVHIRIPFEALIPSPQPRFHTFLFCHSQWPSPTLPPTTIFVRVTRGGLRPGGGARIQPGQVTRLSRTTACTANPGSNFQFPIHSYLHIRSRKQFPDLLTVWTVPTNGRCPITFRTNRLFGITRTLLKFFWHRSLLNSPHVCEIVSNLAVAKK